MRCTAGKNYLFISHDGKIYRCTHDRENGFPSIGTVRDLSFLDGDIAECGNITACESIYRGDWNRSARLSDSGEISCGECVANPATELVAKLSLTGICNYNCFYCDPQRLPAKRSEELPVDTWLEFLSAAHSRFSCCHYHVQGTVGEPLLYPDISKVAKKIIDLDDRLYLISNLHGNDGRLDEILALDRPDKIYVAGSIHLSERNFSWTEFVGKIKKIKAKGHATEVFLVGVPTQIFIYQQLHAFFATFGVPVRLLHGNCSPTTPQVEKFFDDLKKISTSEITVMLK